VVQGEGVILFVIYVHKVITAYKATINTQNTHFTH